MWAYVTGDETCELLDTEVVCNGCGSKETLSIILTLAPYRNKCFKCDSEWLDRELEDWC